MATMHASAHRCPHCGVDLRGEPLPATGRSARGATHYLRTVTIEVSGICDGGLYHVCPDCKRAWARWTDPADPLTVAPKHYAAKHSQLPKC